MEIADAGESAAAPGVSSVAGELMPHNKKKKKLEEWVPFDSIRCSPSEEWIDKALKMRKQEGKLNAKLRKQEEGFIHMEKKTMFQADYEGKLLRAFQPKAKFQTGQSVHHWWASWFAKAEKPLMHVKGNKRPAWFDANIYAALEPQAVKYAGIMWPEGPVYQVH